MRNNIFNIAAIDIDCQAESHRILNLYTRYMLKKFKFNKYNHSTFKFCPRYENYYFHVNGLLIKAKKNLYSQIYNFNYPPSCCKEIDLIVKKFLLKKYKVNVNYIGGLKLKNNPGYINFRLKLLPFIRDLIFDLKPISSKNNNKRKSHKIKNSRGNVLILAHDLSSSFEAYKNLPKKLSYFLKKENINSKVILPSEIGINIYEKIKFLKIILEKIIKSYFVSFLKLSDYHFIILEFYNEIYRNKLRKYFSRNNILFIICSYIDSRYEPLYYEVARDLNIKYYNYDYSLGYPVLQTKNLRYLPDTRKFSDFIFANSNFRKEQYEASTSFLNNPPIILPNICPQSDYSVNVKSLTKLNSSKITIGIVDNIFNEDYAINFEDINSLINLLTDNNLKINFILQSKRGHLEKEFIRLNLKNYLSGVKGDFSKLSKSDLIISIGWQSTALKAASIFKKPFIFYTKNDFPYENNIFSFKKNKNIIIKKYCKKLWFKEENLTHKISSLLKEKNQFINLQQDSANLLKEIGFYENKIEDYFNHYFKD